MVGEKDSCEGMDVPGRTVRMDERLHNLATSKDNISHELELRRHGVIMRPAHPAFSPQDGVSLVDVA